VDEVLQVILMIVRGDIVVNTLSWVLHVEIYVTIQLHLPLNGCVIMG
jgi:hypothetical protein